MGLTLCLAWEHGISQNLPDEPYNVTSEQDSIQRSVNLAVDSLQNSLTSEALMLDSARAFLVTTLDSAQSQVARSRILQMIDSVDLRLKRTIAAANEKLESLKSRTVQQLEKLNVSAQLSEKISSFIRDIEGLELSSTGIDLSSVTSTLNSLNLNNAMNLPSVPVTDDIVKVADLGRSIPDVPSVPEELGTSGQDIQQIIRGDSAAIAKASSMAEEKVAEWSGFSKVQEQTGGFDDYQQQLNEIKDPGALAGQGAEQLQQAAMDHFAGREQVLQEAMDLMGKYKDKFSSLSSLANAPRRRPNEMRGKPFIERIVPAFMLQLQKEGNNYLLDINPYIGYRFTGKITAGAGWNQRIAYDTKANDFTSQPRIYGPRVFGEYNLWKGFCPRVEVEAMNAMVAPSTQPSRMDLATRQWVWGAFAGLKKEYRFIKNVKGTALVMFRLFDPNYKSPYSDVLNVRIGFEFPMKKKLRVVE
jgi:hypothetical protein